MLKGEDSFFPPVTVVMSTYNGSPYVEKQLDSILTQDYPKVSILIRDDGSTDNTLGILRRYATLYDNISLIEGDNVGVTCSFFECLKYVDLSAEYVAFSDQDDVWHEDKISRAVTALSDGDTALPLMYYSERNHCDEHLDNTEFVRLNKRGNSFQLSLFDNICSGNTIVVNKKMLDYLRRSDPGAIYYHDWWMSLVATCFGETIYDEVPTLEYRRLAESVSPSGRSGLSLMLYRMAEYAESNNFESISNQNRMFLHIFGNEMNDDNRLLVEKFCSTSRFEKCFHRGRLRQTIGGEILLRMCFLLGKL